MLPEMLEEGGQDFSLDVVGLDTICATALLHYLGKTEGKLMSFL